MVKLPTRTENSSSPNGEKLNKIQSNGQNQGTPILVEVDWDKSPLPKLVNPIESVDTTKKLSKLANVSEKTYRMGAKILNSDNEKLKQEVLSGKKSINTGYKELTGKKENQYI